MNSLTIREPEITFLFQVNLGGMIFDELSNKGVRKKILPEPNPSKVELNKSCSLHQLNAKATEIFIHDINIQQEKLQLGDSSGTFIRLSDEDDWTVGEYYAKNSFQASRHKLYVIAKMKVTVLISIIFYWLTCMHDNYYNFRFIIIMIANYNYGA